LPNIVAQDDPRRNPALASQFRTKHVFIMYYRT
jgi:hypothetical protein